MTRPPRNIYAMSKEDCINLVQSVLSGKYQPGLELSNTVEAIRTLGEKTSFA